MTALPSASVLVRTWSGDDNAWDASVLDVETPNDEGSLASFVPMNDPAFEGLSAEALKGKQPGEAIVSFMADQLTLTIGECPILAVWVLPRKTGTTGQAGCPSGWSLPSCPSVENKINLANMDWEDFTQAVGEDGVFRGF